MYVILRYGQTQPSQRFGRIYWITGGKKTVSKATDTDSMLHSKSRRCVCQSKQRLSYNLGSVMRSGAEETGC